MSSQVSLLASAASKLFPIFPLKLILLLSFPPDRFLLPDCPELDVSLPCFDNEGSTAATALGLLISLLDCEPLCTGRCSSASSYDASTSVVAELKDCTVLAVAGRWPSEARGANGHFLLVVLATFPVLGLVRLAGLTGSPEREVVGDSGGEEARKEDVCR